jgi:hypothetical protein
MEELQNSLEKKEKQKNYWTRWNQFRIHTDHTCNLSSPTWLKLLACFCYKKRNAPPPLLHTPRHVTRRSVLKEQLLASILGILYNCSSHLFRGILLQQVH